MGMLYGATAFGIIVLNLKGTTRCIGASDIFLSFALPTLTALIMTPTIRLKRGFALFSVPTILAGLFCLAVPLLPGNLPMDLLYGNPSVPGVCTGFFMALALPLFFRAAPAGREGLCYGVVLLYREILWMTLFPLLGFSPDARPPEALSHLFTLFCLSMGGAGLFLGAALQTRGMKPSVFPRGRLRPEKRSYSCGCSRRMRDCWS
jgi:hypothetical protein